MRKTKGGNEPPTRFPRPLVECGSKLKIEGLFKATLEFAKEKREHGERLKEREKMIFGEYGGFDRHERAYFFSLLYDAFAPNYDQHMGVETGHYESMRKLLPFASEYLRAPMLDITAGSGEMLSLALELARAGERLRADESMITACGILPDFGEGAIVANEISPLMLEIAEEKLGGRRVAFTSYNALSLPSNWMFRTVLCSQTMHLLSEEDKKPFVQSIHDVLVPGGHAIVLEEDPFLISQTASIDGVGLFIRAIACPIRHYGTLIAYFENGGFQHLEHRAAHAIDSEHIMRLHVFRKSS